MEKQVIFGGHPYELWLISISILRLRAGSIRYFSPLKIAGSSPWFAQGVCSIHAHTLKKIQFARNSEWACRAKLAVRVCVCGGLRKKNQPFFFGLSLEKRKKKIKGKKEHTPDPLHTLADAHMSSHVYPLSRSLSAPSLCDAFYPFLSLTYNLSVCMYTHMHTCILHTNCDRPSSSNLTRERRATHERLARLATLPDALGGWRISYVAVWKTV